LLGFLITLSSAYRLAKFNTDEDQVSSFIGLPTPANALFILSFPLILSYQENDVMRSIIVTKWFLIGVVLVSSFMLNARVKLFALKFKNWGFAANATKYIFLFLSLLLLIVLQFAAIPLIIVVYVLFSLGVYLRKKG
jgi:CDP-diacylglycerol---serine O-phosphatidyltransferase